MRPLRAAWLPFAAAALAACGHSTSPPPPSFSVAQHLDSIAVSAASTQDLGRDFYMTFAIAVLGEGVSAAPVSLSVNGASQTFQGVGLEIVEVTGGPNPVPTDSLFVYSLWTNPDAASLVTMAGFQPDTVDELADTEDTVSNTNFVQTSSSPAIGVGTFTKSGNCRALTSIITASYLLNGTTCTSGKLTGSFQFQVSASGSAPANAFVFGNTSLPAVRIVLPAGDGGQQRLRALRRRR